MMMKHGDILSQILDTS